GTMIGDIQPEAEKSPANFMTTPFHPFQIGAYNNTLKKAILTGGIDQTSVTMATFPTILDFQNHSKDITQFIISDSNTPFATLGTPNEKLNLARAGHTFNWLSGDTTALLVGGGSTGELERMSWHTNGQLDTITVLPTPLATNRYWHTTTAYTHFENQLLLILGGIDANLQIPIATAELYDVANNELVSSFNLSMPQPRVFHTTTYLPEYNKILISGGYDGNNTLGSAIIFEVYGINEGSIGGAFTLLIPMSPARQHHTATYIKENEKVILIGGINENTGELVEEISLFNPNKNKFTPLNCSLVTPRYGHSTSYFINPYNSNEIDILVYGGRNNSNDEAEALDTYEIITLNLACPLEK
ncbi:MAG: kelch repeat-containing protein, partial [Chitinophagales bacterium]